MADNTKIEWTDSTWNVITGCSVVSPGCTNCYAMRLAGTRLRNDPSREGLTVDSKAGPVWNGKVRFNEKWLDQPLRWKRSRMIFVCAHGDLFHEAVTDEWLDKIFAVMALCPQHVFQVLTKRPERMRAYLAENDMAARIAPVGARIMERSDETFSYLRWQAWPLPNVWLGVSAEDQQRADERIPILLDAPAAIRWVSAEPLLGPIDFTKWLHDSDCDSAPCTCFAPREVHVDWIVAGGESGPGARPMHPDWARAIRDQCKAAGVAFNFKQWGAHFPEPIVEIGPMGEVWRATADGQRHWYFDECGKTDAPQERLARVGKGVAGRLLDGVEHNDFPVSSRA